MPNTVEAYKALLETVPCNLCGADEYEVVYPPRYEEAKPDEIANTFRSSGDEVLLDQLVRCKSCGLLYLNPRLRSDVVIGGYSDGTDELFVSQAAGRERTFAKSLKLIERLRPSRGRLLDVGTAGGSFLAVAQRAGWQVAGCEPNRWMSEWAKQHYGLDVVPGTIHDMQLADESFDVVSLWDVLEHTPDPKTTLAECARVLKPGGLLVVNYPDIDSLVARLMGRRWVFLLSVHLYYFTPPTLKRMLAEMGLNVLSTRPHWQSLELGYVLFRMEAYVRPVARAAGWLVKRLGLAHMQIPYWMGQMLVLAEKA
ncbi:MAG: class I SAM-dependent methyltransferase [Anaerolineales bacterium]|nr:class I SAM-dependent methyltransferase [Anaerolineales bacterium]MCW5855396.1 class I SAM-dependent methyltransferase [Anaerolineales bacterium]